MKNLLLLICFLLTISVNTFAQVWTQNNEASEVKFIAKNAGFNTDGTLSDILISTNFNPDDCSACFFKGTANIKSIDTGINKRDRHLLTSEYFDAENFPQLKLESTSITKTGNQKYLFKGNLTIKSVTKAVEFPFTAEIRKNQLYAKGNFEINRREFGVGGKSWILKDKIKIEVIYLGTK